VNNMDCTLSACTCNFAHGVLFEFEQAIIRRTKNRMRNANRAIRYLLLRGQSDYLKNIKKRLMREQEDMSCIRFLLRAFLSISEAESHADEIDNYWGAYWVVGVDLWKTAQSENKTLPSSFLLLDRINLALTGGDEDSLQCLCNIIEGLEEGLSLKMPSYGSWQEVKRVLVKDNIGIVFERFCKHVLGKQEWYKNKHFLSGARGLILLWCHLEGIYAPILKNEGTKRDEKISVFLLFQKEVRNLQSLVEKIITAIDELRKIKGMRLISDEMYIAKEGSFKNSLSEIEDVLKALEKEGFKIPEKSLSDQEKVLKIFSTPKIAT